MTRIQAHLMMRKGDKACTPLQYTYEAADCRIFYTHESFADPVAAWKQAWDAFSQPEGRCVKGSTGHNSSLSGGFVRYGPWTLQDEDLPKPEGQDAGQTPAKETPQQNTIHEGAANKIRASVVALFVTAVVVLMQL